MKTNPSDIRVKFTVYEKEPLTQVIVSLTSCSPVRLGVGFFVLIALPLTLWNAVLGGNVDTTDGYLSYFENISWSLSMIYLFPFVVGLSLKYYKEIPKLFQYLIDNVVQNKDPVQINEFLRALGNRFNNLAMTLGCLLVTVVLNTIYFRQILKDPDPSWMKDGLLGMSGPGLFAAIIQIILIYWVLSLVTRGFVLSWGLYELFNRRGFSVKIDPMHPDGVGGLRPMGYVANIFNIILFLIGIYLSLKVIDKLFMQHAPLGDDIGNPVMLGSYVVLAPLLFFLPIGSAHNAMRAARVQLLAPISATCQRLFGDLKNVKLNDEGARAVEMIKVLEETWDDLRKKIPVWPFDFRSLEAFFGTVIVPLLPILLPFVVGFFTAEVSE
ncbi:MAG: hypothetical protein ACE5NW_13835 [Acidiferrobacterales bacterium]